MLEQEYIHTHTKDNKKQMTKMGTRRNEDICTGLRGEEMLLIELFGTAKSVTQYMKIDSPNPHFKLV